MLFSMDFEKKYGCLKDLSRGENLIKLEVISEIQLSLMFKIVE